MANITEYLQKILAARYGRDVRQSIHDAIDAVNTSAEGSAATAEEAAQKAEAARQDIENVKLQAKATSDVLGAVKYDDVTIKENENGQLYVVDKGGIEDVSEAEVTFEEATERTNIESGEAVGTIFGKIKKFFSDLKAVAFSGSYNDLSDKPSIPTVTNNDLATEAGTAWDAVRGAAIRAEVDAIKSELDNKIGYGTDVDKLISNITDFNDAREFGSYRSTLIAQILSIANRPPDITEGGHVRLDVMALSIGTSYTLQRLYYATISGELRIYERVYLTSWSDWECISMKSDLPTLAPSRLVYTTSQTPSSTGYERLKLNASAISTSWLKIDADGTYFTLSKGAYWIYATVTLKNTGTAATNYYVALDQVSLGNRFSGSQFMLGAGELRSVNWIGAISPASDLQIGLEINNAPQVAMTMIYVLKIS